MALTFTSRNLLPVRRDKQVGGAATTSTGGGGVAGMGVSYHNSLPDLQGGDSYDFYHLDLTGYNLILDLVEIISEVDSVGNLCLLHGIETEDDIKSGGDVIAYASGSGSSPTTDSFKTWHLASDAGYSWASSDIVASGLDTIDIIAGTNITLATDATNKAIRITATGGVASYPGAGIALSTGSGWDTSITNNSANWNTAYGWGNHAGLYRPISYVPSWGTITGTLSNQTDLNSALGAKADLVGGTVPSSQLPSYVDDVLEYANLASFPNPGESAKIYVALDTNLTYRWTGSSYVEISQSLALGETSSTAYRGDRGKTAYDFSQSHLSAYNHDNIAHGETAYNWGNHASAGYAVKANNETISGAYDFTAAVDYAGGHYSAKVTGGDLWMASGKWVTFGSNAESAIWLDGGAGDHLHFYINKYDVATHFIFYGKDAGGVARTLAKLYPRAGCEFYYTGTKRLETTDVGITVTGTVTGTQLISNIAIGTAPLVITSTTKVNNLYVDRAVLADTITAADTTDSTCFIALFESATGNMAIKTDGGLTYNASNGNLMATGDVIAYYA